jgi:hypothetical protein
MARCGGVRAFAEGSAPLSPGDFIAKWISLIAPAQYESSAHTVTRRTLGCRGARARGVQSPADPFKIWLQSARRSFKKLRLAAESTMSTDEDHEHMITTSTGIESQLSEITKE